MHDTATHNHALTHLMMPVYARRFQLTRSEFSRAAVQERGAREPRSEGNKAKGKRRGETKTSVSRHSGAVKCYESLGGSEESLMEERSKKFALREKRVGGILCKNAALHESFGGVYIHAEVSGTRSCVA